MTTNSVISNSLIKKTRIIEKNRGVMKITFTLNNENGEAEAFKAFSDGIKPTDMSIEDFCKMVFMAGCNAIHQSLVASVAEHAMEEVSDNDSEVNIIE